MGRFTFGPASLAKLQTCHPLMRDVFEHAMLWSPRDFTITTGWRGQAEQNAAVLAGNSKTPWPTSKHNFMVAGKPASLAVDFAPWFKDAPHIRWTETEEFRFLAGFIIGIGTPIVEPKGYRLRWGGDFDRDGDDHEGGFEDLPHIEIEPL